MKNALRRTTHLALALIGSVPLAAMAEPLSTSTLDLQPGETFQFTIESDRPLMVGFGFELGTVIGRTAKTCIVPEGSAMGLPFCGRVVQLNEDGSEGYAFISSMHGGAIGMTPEDGVIRARLESLALVRMSFTLEINEVD